MLQVILRILLLFCFSSGLASAHGLESLVVNATMTSTAVILDPEVIPENVPFIIHVINQAGAPVELENTDTSVEVYPQMDKTFKIGLPAGRYVFFNDFNSQTKPATLVVGGSVSRASRPVAGNIAAPAKVSAASSANATAAPLETTEILFIVWRESVEALLVIGIVYGWLKQVPSGRRSGLLALWLGVGLGLLFAVVLGVLLIQISRVVSGVTQDYLQAGMALLAAVMIFYMVRWMRNNGRNLKSTMHDNLSRPASVYWRNFAILSVVAVAIAREGSEAAIFIYALGFGQTGSVSPAMLGILALGVVLAILTIYILQLSQRFLSWKTFFRITEVLLLLLGGGLLLHVLDLLTTAGLISFLQTKVWNTAFLISDSSRLAPILASFTGYRAAPSLLDLLVYALYWILVYTVIYKKSLLPRRRTSSCRKL